ncbi:MAG: aromatic amino acid transport family protein [Candidatus Staskawiczbacteria bacterium]|nr:aromatic amino acid transport family protein [Candidatus Staskawiczbacteria bacterium]
MLSGKIFRDYVFPVATISGTIIGVGFFALPYITVKVGVLPMLIYFVALTFVVVNIHLIFGEISLKTPDFKRLPGFVEYHLGKWPGKISSLVSTVGLFGLLLVYLVVGSNFLTNIFSPIFGGGQFNYALIYFVTAVVIIYFGIKIISKVELAVICFLILSLIFIFVKGAGQMKVGNLFISNFKFQISNFFLPYGPIIFSLWGTGIIPETEELLSKNKKTIRKVIIIATLIPAIIYTFFVVGVLLISGPLTTEAAFEGLEGFLGPGVVAVGFIIGTITTFVGFIVSGLTLRKILMFDLKVKHFPALIITCSVPLILFLLGLNSFIYLISFIGGVLLSIDGIFILLMYKKIGGKNIIIYPLSLVFIAGIMYQIIYLLI